MPSKGYVDNWFVNFDASGVITGEVIIGGDASEFPANVVLTLDGGFVVATASDSYISGDKTQDSKGREDYWVYKMASVFLGVSDYALLGSVSLYPNPSNGIFTIDLGKEYTEVTVKIYNILGQIISSKNYASAKTIEQQIHASAGMYFVKVSTAKEGSNTLRIIKH